MGFLKKSNAPSELPDLAISSLDAGEKRDNVLPSAPAGEPVVSPVQSSGPESVAPVSNFAAPVQKVEEPVRAPVSSEVKRVDVDEILPKDGKVKQVSFFDEILEDINGEMSDVGKLEDWYQKKFVDEDVVQNMKGYWGGKKADIIIESFGAEYKRQINEKVKVLQELEEDWREIYFRLVKKEEEMKKEERELKETLSEFVDLCKRRKDEEKSKKPEEK